jgi:hypothetical protein
MRQQNIGVNKIQALTKYRRRQNIAISLLFWPGKVHSSWLFSDLAGILLKVLSPPHVDAEWGLQPACQLIRADYLPHCPGLVVPAPHAKSQNIGTDKNLGAGQDFTGFHQFPAVYISASGHPI